MRAVKVAPIMAFFSKLEDPRAEVNKLYPLEDVAAITILAVMSSDKRSAAKGWEDGKQSFHEQYGQAKAEWLGKFLKLENEKIIEGFKAPYRGHLFKPPPLVVVVDSADALKIAKYLRGTPEEEWVAVPLLSEEEEGFRADITMKEFLKKERGMVINRLHTLYGNVRNEVSAG